MASPSAPTPPPHRRARIILHGGRAEDETLRSAVATLRDEGHELEVRVTWEEGDGVRIAREAVAEGMETVVAAGGDGMAHEVVRGLLGAATAAPTVPSPSLGILPLGTGNDFATAAGVPDETIDALRLALERPARLVDVGTVDGRPFLNMATGGFGTDATASTPDELKKVMGSFAYLLTGLTKMTSVEPVVVRLNGPDFRWSGPLLVLAVGNGRLAGGGHRLCPDALADDGQLDLCVLPEMESGRLGMVLKALSKGGLQELDERIVRTRLPWLEVVAPDGLNVNLDGEPIFGTGFRFEIQPGRLRVHLPADSPLVGR
jgi:lipid kinase YegS